MGILVEEKMKSSSLKKEEVVKKYLPLVRKIATSLARRSLDPVEDLIQVGSIGLLEAAERYEEKYETEFTTYATHFITGHIRHYLRDKQNLIKGPRSLQELSYRLNGIINNLTQKLGRDPNNIEIAESLQMPSDRVDEIKVYDKRVTVLWLDQEMIDGNEDDNYSLMDFVSFNKDKENDYDIDTKLLISNALDKLPPIQKEILDLRYFKDMTQTEISKHLNISQMEVCRRLKKAKKSLKALLSK